jgi:hypothetical protein
MAVVMDTVATASGLLKTVYDKGVVDALPDNELITEIVGYGQSEKLGAQFQSSVNLAYGHSVTPMGDKEQNMTLNTPAFTPLQNATATSYVFVYRDILSATIMQRATGSNEQAFESATAVAFERAKKSFTKIMEETLNYGTLGLAQFVGVTGDLSNSQVQISAAEWAPGLWIASRDMPIDIYTAAGVKVLSTTVTAMADLTNRKLTLASVSGLANGTTYTIFRAGFRNFEAPGLQAILTSTSPLFGIPSDGTFDLWTPNTYSCNAGSLLFSKVARGVATYRPKGLAKNLVLVTSEDAFVDAIPDYNTTTQTSASPGARTSRVFMNADDTLKLLHGSTDVSYKINTTSVTIKSSPYQKNGYAPLIEPDSLIRLGSFDKPFTFYDLGGAAGEPQYFRALENMNAYEFRLASDTALFTSERNRSMIFTGIVNNTAA